MSLKESLSSTIYNSRLRFNDDWRLRYSAGDPPDITGPTLSSPTGVKTGQTTANGGCDTNELGGILYIYISTSATPPADPSSPAGSSRHQSQPVLSTGTQLVSITSLSPGVTYYAHYQQYDLANNPSNIVTSASFTTDSAVLAPVFSGTILNQVWTVDEAIPSINLNNYFTGGAVTSWSTDVSLPTGIEITSGGILQGTPTNVNDDIANIVVTGTNVSGSANSNSFSIIIADTLEKPLYGGLEIYPLLYPADSAITNFNFAAHFSGTVSTYTWDDTWNSLPTGLTLNSNTGILSGTPTVPGAYRGRVIATNTEGAAYTAIIPIIILHHDNFTYGANTTLDNGTSFDYYVDANVESSGSGTSLGTAFKTIQEAIDAAGVAGGTNTIGVVDGIYRETVDFGNQSWTHCTLSAYGTGRPTIDASDILTGWVACDSGDAARVGSNWAQCYKLAVPSAFYDNDIPPEGFNIHEAGVLLPLSFDKDVAGDPAFTKVFEEYHDATSYGLNGGNIETITHAAVLGNYTENQLLNALVYYPYGGNFVATTGISAYNGSDTITISDVENIPLGSSTKYALFNTPLTAAGQWMYESTTEGDGSRYIYIWPNDVRNLDAKITMSTRTYCLNVNRTSDITIKGINAFYASGSLTRQGVCMGTVSNATTTPARNNIIFEDCVAGKNWSSSRGYGGIYLALADNSEIRNCTVLQTVQSFGTFTQRCNDYRVKNMLWYRTGQATHRSYGNNYTDPYSGQVVLDSIAFVYGFDEHANAMNFYEGQLDVLVKGLRFYAGRGYLTWQEATDIYIIESYVEASLGFYADGAPDGRSIVDQGGTSPSGGDNEIYVWNCTLPPLKDSTVAHFRVGSVSTTDYYFYNMICDGGGAISTDAANLQDSGNSLYTGLLSGLQNSGDLDPTDTLDTTYSNTYVDRANGNFNYVNAGSAGKVGRDVSRLAEDILAVKFPDVDFTKDINGNTLSRLHVGAGYPGFQAANTEPRAFLDAQFSLSDPATDGDLTLTVSSLPFNGGAALTDLEWTDDDGSSVYSIGSTSVGVHTLSGLTNDVVANIRIRAVNSVGNGLWSKVKSETPTAGAGDVTSPILSNVKISAKLATSLTLNWDTNEGNGAGYVLVDQNATRTDVQVEAGGGSFDDSAVVSSSGTQTPFSITGLTANTAYYIHLVHKDAAGNYSDVKTIAFTTYASYSETMVSWPGDPNGMYANLDDSDTSTRTWYFHIIPGATSYNELFGLYYDVTFYGIFIDLAETTGNLSLYATNAAGTTIADVSDSADWRNTEMFGAIVTDSAGIRVYVNGSLVINVASAGQTWPWGADVHYAFYGTPTQMGRFALFQEAIDFTDPAESELFYVGTTAVDPAVARANYTAIFDLYGADRTAQGVDKSAAGNDWVIE